MMNVSSHGRRSSLLFHLGQAHSKISSLEDYIRDRERQFRTVVSRFERSESRSHVAGSRLRRVGLSHNLLHMMRSVNSQEEEEQEEMDAYSRPFSNYSCLKILRVLPSSDDDPTPFSLYRLVSREYHVSEEGLVIGSGEGCALSLPPESALKERHVQIKWIPADGTGGQLESSGQQCERRGSKLLRQERIGAESKHAGHFEVHDLTKGKGAFYISHDSLNLHHITILEDNSVEEPHPDSSTVVSVFSPDSELPVLASAFQEQQTQVFSVDKFVFPIHYGIKFVAGKLEFGLTAPPTELLYTLWMFDAAKRGDLNELRYIVESSKSEELVTPYVAVTQPENSNTNRLSTISVSSNRGVDVNVEYQKPAYSDDAFLGGSFSRRRSSVRNVSLLSPLLSPGASSGTVGGGVCVNTLQEHKLLLHIAIEKSLLDMVTYLLTQNADVNLCVGELNRNALHLAAEKNLPAVMLELLRYGGDVEIRDALHLQPLSLTANYKVRQLLINTVLLCAAAEAGDYDEVERLLSTTNVSPNARGLRHKNALHLAAAKGHKQVVEFLLMNGADVNGKGGSRLRTPLHYASLNDHVEVAMVLLEAGANQFVRDSGGYTPLNLSMGGKMCKLLHKEPLSLSLAVQSGDVESVKRLVRDVSTGVEEGGYVGGNDIERTVDQRNEQSHAPLHLACTSGNVEMVKVLVAHGASIDLRGGSDSWTPLMYAAMAGHGQVVEFLLSVGADSQEVDERGCTVKERLEQACEETKELIRQLESKIRSQSLVDTSLHTLEPASMIRQESGSSFSLETEKAWLKERYSKLQETLRVLTSGPDRLLKYIETKNHSEFVSLLESEVVGPNTMVDKYSPCSALVRVCEKGLYKFAKTLIEHGAQVNGVGPTDQVPILVAAGNGDVELVKLLHESDADINVQSEDSLSTPLHEAAAINSIGCVGYLLSVGARQDLCDAAGGTPFDCATLHEVKKMLAVGPNKLLLAAGVGDCQEVQRLINEEGLSPSHVYPRGMTALHEACEAMQVETAKLLIENGADVNKQTHSSMLTPLHLASQNNSIEIVRLLISAGAKLDLKDVDGKVPFEVACSNQMRKVLVEARSVHTQPVPRESSTTEKKCMICMDNPINTIILPCGHQAFCTSCVSRIATCALDRQAIREVITVFK